MAARPEPDPSWPAVAALASFDDACTSVARAFSLEGHAYLNWLRAPATTRDAWRTSQVPFRFAVEGFPQALAAVLARIPRTEDRLGVLDNLTEEHGRGTLAASHKHTFLQYLRALGATEAELSGPCPAHVLAFHRALRDLCLASAPEEGAAALGMIEHLYVAVSAAIARTIVARAWVAPGSQSHYAAHEALDVGHARDLLDVARPAWERAPDRPAVAQGLLLGAWHFRRLLDDLLPFDAAAARE